MGLSAEQKAMVKSSWGTIAQDMQGNGKVMFAKIFEDADTRALWKFTNTCEGNPVESPDMATHITRIFTRLNEVIGKIDDEAAMVALLKSTGSTHGPYGIKTNNYGVVGGGLIHMLSSRLGGEFSDDMKTAWLAVWEVVIASMF